MTGSINMLLESAVMGFAIAAPVGPIGVLCIRRTLANGIPHGVASGLGAATADAFYGSLIAFGLSAITALLLDLGILLNLVGGAFLLYLGVTTIRSTISMSDSDESSKNNEEASSKKGLFYSYLSTLALTITNPMTILVFLGIFAGFGDTVLNAGANSSLIVLGVFLGSAAWWLLLSFGMGLLRTKVTPARLVWINRFSGLLICGFALRILLDVII